MWPSLRQLIETEPQTDIENKSANPSVYDYPRWYVTQSFEKNSDWPPYEEIPASWPITATYWALTSHTYQQTPIQPAYEHPPEQPCYPELARPKPLPPIYHPYNSLFISNICFLVFQYLFFVLLYLFFVFLYFFSGTCFLVAYFSLYFSILVMNQYHPFACNYFMTTILLRGLPQISETQKTPPTRIIRT